jgi:hypothetical protein
MLKENSRFRAVWYKSTAVSEEYLAYTFRTDE